MKLQQRIAAGIVTVLAVVGVSVVLLHRPRPPGPPEAKAPVLTTNVLHTLSREATNATPSSLPQAQARHGVRFDPLQLMKDSLDLTDGQARQLEPVFKAQQKRLAELRANTALSRQERAAKLKEMRQTTDEQIMRHLTPEQFEKWRKGRPNLQAALQHQVSSPPVKE